jgi:hypothetical protein
MLGWLVVTLLWSLILMSVMLELSPTQQAILRSRMQRMTRRTVRSLTKILG